MKYLYLLAFGIFAIETAVIIAMGKLYSMLSDENDELKEDVQKQKKNISVLVNHAEELTLIQKAEDETAKKLQESKTDEEVADIIAGIIAANNSRVRNDRAD